LSCLLFRERCTRAPACSTRASAGHLQQHEQQGRCCASQEGEEQRELERRQFKEAQELESLRRTFKRINHSNTGKICTKDVEEEFSYLGYSVGEQYAVNTIWEVDDDNDGFVDWEEFRAMFFRVRNDETGCEPRKLFQLVDFLMLDKNHTGSVDQDECLTLLWARYGKEDVDKFLADMQREKHPSLVNDVEKSFNYSFFAEIQKRCTKKRLGTGIKEGAMSVPQVKGLGFITDPKFSHLS